MVHIDGRTRWSTLMEEQDGPHWWKNKMVHINQGVRYSTLMGEQDSPHT